MGWESSGVVRSSGLGWQTNLQEIMGWESFYVVRFDLGPSFKVKQGYPNLKVLISCL